MNIFTQIEQLIPKLHRYGWCSREKAFALASTVLAHRPELIVEIGVYGGSSLVPLALAAKEIGRCKVMAIDPWSAACSAVDQVNPEDKKFWSDQKHHDEAFAFFNSNLAELGLVDIVEIRRARSDDIEPPSNIGLAHVDGNHGPQAIKDVERFAPKCLVGSLMFCDDPHWSGGAVLKAIEKAKTMGFKELYSIGNGCCVMQRL